MAFAALHRLLLPLLGSLAGLPGPQAVALEQVFGLRAPSQDSSGNERFLIYLAALGLLTEAAAHQPLLCLVDDAHWLDEASSAALQFIARRIELEPIALVFAARDGDARRFDPGGLGTLRLGGLSPEAAEQLLVDSAGVPVPGEVRAQLVSRTGGNPLALIELPTALSSAQMEGAEALPAHLPLTDGLERVFLERHHRLPEAARTLLLVAATDDSGDLVTIRRAAESITPNADGLLDAERSGLVTVTGTRLELRHPLVRSAIYSAALSSERRAAHAALADALTGRGDTERAVWHRASALDEPDERTAEQLVAVGEASRSRGGHEAASAAWQRAAELSPAESAHAQRLHQAAVSSWLAGHPSRAKMLAQATRSRTTDPQLLADADRVRAFVEMNFGSPQLAHGIMMRAARDCAAVAPARARELAMIATAFATFGFDSGIGIDPMGLVAPIHEHSDPHERCFAELLAGMDYLVRGETEKATPALRRALALFDQYSNADLLANIGIAALHLGDDAAALHWHDVQLDEARQQVSPLHILHALTRRSFIDLTAGRWSAVVAVSAEVLDLAAAINQGNQRVLPLAELTLIEAWRGGSDYERMLLEAEAAHAAHPAGVLDGIIRDILNWAKAVRCNRDHPAQALHHLNQLTNRMIRRAAAIDRIEMAIRVGRADAAADAIADVAGFADATGAAWAAAAADHGRALTADAAEAEAYFQSALDHHGRSIRLLDRARTELAYGEFLRRARRRVDARVHLRNALSIFDDLGATPLADRAREELRASGETVGRRDMTGGVTLTPQEAQVARLVQEGLANRDVAARLFVSPRTVDFHLRNVFTKLGVSSRGALAQIDLDAVA